jgi:hypothetical protein
VQASNPDGFYETLLRNGISGALLRTLNETNQQLLPELTRLQMKVAHTQMQQQARAKVQPPPIEIEGLPDIDD